MIEAHGLSRRYGDFTAVEGVSFAVDEGEIVGILGPNGAGKTTTLRMVTGFLPPSDGTVTVAGRDLLREPLRARRELGYLPENVALYPEMRVAEYLAYRARLQGMPRGEVRSALDEAVERTLLTGVRDQVIGTLSKGYRQRVGLAAAILHRPRVLVLDEPTVGLDPKQIIAIRELIRELGRRRTLLLSTHILPEVELLCDRVLIIDRGRIVAQGTPAELTARSRARRSLRVELRAGSGEDRAGEVRIGEGRIDENRIDENRIGEVAALLVALPGVEAAEPVATRAWDAGEVLPGSARTGSVHTGSARTGSAPPGSARTGPAQAGPDPSGPDRSGPVPSGVPAVEGPDPAAPAAPAADGSGSPEAGSPGSGVPAAVAASGVAPSGGGLAFRLAVAAEADPREAVFRAAVERGWVLLEMVEERASLEDVFVRLTTDDPVRDPGAGPGAGSGRDRGPDATARSSTPATAPSTAPAAEGGSTGAGDGDGSGRPPEAAP